MGEKPRPIWILLNGAFCLLCQRLRVEGNEERQQVEGNQINCRIKKDTKKKVISYYVVVSVFFFTPVLLNPPTNITVQNGSDFNLYFYWNQTFTECVESEVRFRANNKKWEVSELNAEDGHQGLVFCGFCLSSYTSPSYVVSFTDVYSQFWETELHHQLTFQQISL